MIEILTTEQEPFFRDCNCIVCKRKPVFRIIRMGGHETQMCDDCARQLCLALLGEFLTTGERTNDNETE